MKKRNAKSLKLRKSSISNLENNQVKGGAPISYNNTCTSFIDACPSAWYCPPTEDPKQCPFPY